MAIDPDEPAIRTVATGIESVNDIALFNDGLLINGWEWFNDTYGGPDPMLAASTPPVR